MSEAKASHPHRMWAKVSSSASHLLHKGLLFSPIKWKCLFRVLCPVARPVTTLYCVLLLHKPLARNTTNRGAIHSPLQAILVINYNYSRSQRPRDLRRGSVATRLLRLWVQIPPGAWMFVCCECCVLSGRGLYDELITHPEPSYRLWRIAFCDLETSGMRRQTSLNCDWVANWSVIRWTGSPRWRGPRHVSLQVRLPASPLAYRILCTLIAD